MSKSKDGLYEKLNSYSDGDVYPFHMPGHKRNMPLFKSAYDYDITEIEGFDNLHHARGILRESMDMAAGFYGTKKTYYLVNGSTCGLLSAISAVVEYGDKIIIARNCHKAVYNAVYMNNLKASYIYPKPVENTSILGGIHPKDVEKALEENPDAKAVVITSPTYEGVVSYVQAIAKVVHEKGIPLIADEAHGAHFSMSGYFPKSALECGADIVIQSVHKTLPSLTQTALLHICSDMVDESKVERYLSIYQ
ncbi:MAG: aminotransferase class V-fold PLP-dependent enzyme, partial [Lachnospiraceae bacterium]|nr:aminotransferase class V-fold PLP-dependent enzyme [Lachnospiraceae bacterium]